MEFQSLQVSEEFKQAVGNLTPGVGQNLWLFFACPNLSPVFLQICPTAQSATQMSRTVTLYVCTADCTVRCGYTRLLAMIFKISEKFNSMPLIVIVSLHFLN